RPEACRAIALDFDGTLATRGRVADGAVACLRAASGRFKLVLATGRQIAALVERFPELGLFDRVLAEDGAVLYWPGTQETELLCDPPPPAFIDALRARHCDFL